MYLLSNRYYNQGLEKAKVRDLSGAVLILKKSLELNKRNTDARNLLGLVYYEMGEAVAALSEWVISKHFQAQDNDADSYMEAVQSNPTKLETLNQTTKKYNAALIAAKQGNEDLAIIQLKKVTNLNPHFVKALQLLALLYMKSGESDKAVKCLVKANKIDVSNTTTLKYLKELGELANPVREDGKAGNKDTSNVVKEPSVFPKSTYKEERPNVWLFINLIIGVVIGVLGTVFLIVPTVENNYTNQLKSKEIEYNEELNKQTQSMGSLEKDKTDLEEQIDTLQAQIDEYNLNVYDDTIYDDLLNTAKTFNDELLKGDPNAINYTEIANKLSKVNADKLERPQALTLYNQIKDAVYLNASEELYDQGHDLYTGRKYDDALEALLKAYDYNPQNDDAVYFIARSYQQLNDDENAAKYYNIILEQFPDSNREEDATDHLAEVQ